MHEWRGEIAAWRMHKPTIFIMQIANGDVQSIV